MKHKTTTISFHTIGCRLNQYETAVLQNIFQREGFRIVASTESADIAVINTCTVTKKSDTDTRRFVNKMIRLNPGVKIALVGCQAQLQQETLAALPNVRWIIGNAHKFDLAKIIHNDTGTNEIIISTPEIKKTKSFRQPVAAIDREHTRANLKIQDGCNNFCTYCEVPYARGSARSREFNDIIAEAEALTHAGHKEIILTGINVGTYTFKNKTLLDVIKTLEKIPKLKRLRVSSIEPTAVLTDIISFMSRKTKLCRYLHIPIQYGHDDILKLMKRKYSVKKLQQVINAARKQVPDICIGTDVIVGFPGETEKHFEETYNLLKILPVNYFHVFSFSKRANAKAKDFKGQVPIPVVQKRSARLRALGRRKRKQFYEHMLGKTVSVLFEQQKQGLWQGLTDNFIQVRVFSDRNLKNKMSQVKLMDIHGRIMTGRLTGKDKNDRRK